MARGIRKGKRNLAKRGVKGEELGGEVLDGARGEISGMGEERNEGW